MKTNDVFKYKTKINELLEERPEYKEYQLRLEEKLKNAGSAHNRMVLLKSMMLDNLLKIADLWKGV